MEKILDEFRKLRSKGYRQKKSYGAKPDVSFSNYEWLHGLAVFLFSGLISFFVLWIGLDWILGDSEVQNAYTGASYLASFSALFYYLYPVLNVIVTSLWNRQIPSRYVLNKFPYDQKIVSAAIISFGLVYAFSHSFPVVQYILNNHQWPSDYWNDEAPYLDIWWHFGAIWFCVTVVFALAFPYCLPKVASEPKNLLELRILKNFKKEPKILPTPFCLWLGKSTGRLSKLWHQSGLAPNLNVALTLEDAAQNILVLGGIGSGKTTRIMQPLLVQLLDQDCGGLLFDVKGDVQEAAIWTAHSVGREIKIIGPKHQQMNLLAGLTPEVAACFLKSVFLLGGGSKSESFWIDTATELCRNTLGLLSFLKNRYTLQNLYEFLFDEEAKEQIQLELNPLLISLPHEELRRLKTYLRYHETIFCAFDEKVKSGVNATVAQVLSPFAHPELIDAFCQNTENNLDMELIMDGVIYLVDMPLSRWGLGGKVAYTFIKLKFFNTMQDRIHNPEWNQDRPVFFMCDEYQDLVSASRDGLSDLNFWDKSRSTKTIGIISSQSISSFYAAIGNRDVANALLQNFRQKICFRTEDQETLSVMEKMAGQAVTFRKSFSQTKGKSSEFFGKSSKNSSSTQGISEHRESVVDAALFRSLSPNQAVALLSIHGYSMDDVLELMPVFI